MKHLVAFVTLFAVLLFNAHADQKLRMPAIISDNMVLQAGKDCPIWGWAKAKSVVKVTVQGDVTAATEATAGDDGKWQVKLPQMKAGQSCSLTIQSGEETVTIKNIEIGEVWVCSGQSNMEWSVRASNNASAEIAAAKHPKIRLFHLRRAATLDLQDDCTGKWVECNPETIPGFSAVGYYFGRELLRKLEVPIGLINTSWGGTPAQSWTHLDDLKANSNLQHYVKRYESAVLQKSKIKTMDEYNAAMAKFNASTKFPDPGNKGLAKGYAKGDFDDAAWKEMPIPSLWEKQGLKINGVVWFRHKVEIPADWAGRDLKLNLGKIDDCDISYFNGVQVGMIDKNTENHWSTPRKYTVPGKLVKAGPATIAVRVFDDYYGGGLYGPASDMSIAPADGNGTSIALAGKWKYEIAHRVDELVCPMKPNERSPHTPSALYNGMINPIIPLAIRGAIWYQGESNAWAAHEYRTLFPEMIKSWRRHWGQGDFPFLWVQLANYKVRATQPGASQWAELREAQSMTLSLPNTGQAVIIDIGDAKDIHPRNKQDVGKRLSFLARKLTYGQDLVHSSPMYKSMKVEDGKVILTFEHVGTGLMAKGGKLPGFEIAGKDQKFVWADARIIGSNQVEVSSGDVPAPLAVRYGWADNPDATLYNKEGLPASPFRTDSWKGVTQR